MIMIGFIIALLLCLPLSIGNAIVAEWGGWDEVGSWPIFSVTLVALLLRIATLKRWQTDARDVWWGALLGIIAGSGAFWGLRLYG